MIPKIKSYFSSFEWLLAGRYLRAQRRQGFISVIAGFSFLGILLGVATLIIVLSVMGGFRKELMGKILGVNGHVFVQPIGEPFTDYDAVAKRLSAVKGVKLAAPLVEGQVLAASQTASSGALVRGLREEDLKRFEAVAGNIKEGGLADFDKGQGIAIGKRLAGHLNVGLGDKIRLISPRGASTPMGSTPRSKAYPVSAIFEVGMSEFDAGFIFMPFPEAQLFFDSEDQAANIEVFVDKPDKIDPILALMNDAAGRPVMLTDWRFRNRTFFGALEVERNVMFLILTLIVLVAALNIISGLTMLVKDKARGIAILRTMGATRQAILKIFIITGASIGVTGTIFGTILGLIVTLNIESLRQFVSSLTGTQIFPPELYFLSKLPAVIDMNEVLTVVLMALTLSLLATLYPAWQAAKLDPVEALRFE